MNAQTPDFEKKKETQTATHNISQPSRSTHTRNTLDVFINISNQINQAYRALRVLYYTLPLQEKILVKDTTYWWVTSE